MASILVLAAHPNLQHSRIHRTLLKTLRQAAPVGVEVRDLYALYPDYLIDVPAEQAALAGAQLVVWQHPLQWYGMPPLMKLWVDEVLSYGWAYGSQGTHLRGKDLWLVTSTGGSAHAYSPGGYNHHPFEAFLPPYSQTAALCGMRFLPPRVLHAAHRASEPELQAFTAGYLERLATYPDWTLHLSPTADTQRAVASSDRPAP
ncbi:NAD(P)H-dependent oxidoreductase [Aquincola sp. MAHUQ-54]|uniref:NAD(P)H-dependent oxidoreductase n=1 Tax=Aquincola agrisoli TaxID=3119538 RepID=A0AAW9QEZ1_9BURK